MIPFLQIDIFLVIGLPIIAAIMIFLIVFSIKAFSKNKKDKKTIITDENFFLSWINAFGGIDNIQEVKSSSSRLIVFFKDKDKVNKTLLNALNPLGTMFMSTKIIVTATNASQIADYINSKLK